MGLLAILLLAFPPFVQEEAPVFRATTARVRVDVQVGEKQRLLSGLSKEDFIVYDEGQPQEILYFARESEPLDVLLLLDVSGSMRRYLEQMANSAREALAGLHDGDRVGLMLFSRNTEVREELTDDRSRVIGGLKQAVRADHLGSGTRINPAILDAAAYMAKQDVRGRRAILIVTDNTSLNYLSPDEKAIEALLAADTVLNAIVVGGGDRPKPPRPGVYVNPDFTPPNVFRIAEETGGEAVKARNAGNSFRDMLESIRTRYSIQYRAPDTAATGSFRRIRVELSPETRRRHPRAWIRARSGYVVQ
ncbi:MAG TPA: VWA domain-containing protein [Bryobacteraceae bacterium]|nr:VWA domain-containing protein [Bryobacteraceae bacterium]